MTSVRTLFLIFLSSSLVATGRATCLFPVLNGKHVLSSESRLKNEFPDGSTAVAECAKGHEAKDGSPLITCQNGKWSNIELICEKMDCGPPIPSAHMTYLINEGTLFGAYVKPVCDTGYDLEGSSYRQCLVTGWNGASSCVLITCEDPTNPKHGNVTFRNPVQYNDVVEYSCDENYTLVGNRFITCGDDWDYNSPPPKCEAIECEVPAIKFGNQTEGNPPYLHKSRATFECLPGYRMNGLATSVCEERGWSALPECVEVIPLQPTESTIDVASTVTSAIYKFIAEEEQQEELKEEEEDREELKEEEQEEVEHFITVLQSESSYNAIWLIIVIPLATLAILAIIGSILRYNCKHKGSYNTGEDRRTKDELLLFQSL